jgi:hypothetical protein
VTAVTRFGVIVHSAANNGNNGFFSVEAAFLIEKKEKKQLEKGCSQ